MKRRRRLLWAGSVAMAAILTGYGTTACTSSPEPDRGQACARAGASFTVDPGTYAEVGKLGDAKGSARPFVVVLDEQHASRGGQVELAIMLNRLHRTAGLRHLALEGSVVEKPLPDLGWFTSLPDPGVRRAVALQLLKDGEVSAAEFAAMVLPGFTLHAVEREQEHQVDISAEDERAYTGYLTAIAAMTMTPSQVTQVTALLDQDKDEEAIRAIVDSSPWTSERYRLLGRKVPVVTTAEMRALGTELEEKARLVGADTSAYRAGFQRARTFFDTAAQRSRTMTDATVDIVKTKVEDCTPVALNVGAAHSTEVADALRQDDVSYAVVSPQALSSESRNDALTGEAYERKLKAQSVDPVGAVGAYLDGRRKPPPSSGTDWFKAKAELAYAAVVIARAAAKAGGGGQPPFGLDGKALGLGGSGPEQPRISVDLSSISVVPVGTRTDVVFKVALLAKNTDVWVRAGAVAQGDEFLSDDSQALEQQLKKVLKELKEAPPAEEPRPSGEPRIVHFMKDVQGAVVGTKAEAVAVAFS